jgi:Flp pilus assembly protein TadG
MERSVTTTTCRRLSRGRLAAAAVEFALVLPFLATILLGMFEISRAILIRELLSDAAQSASRRASLPGKTNADVTAQVDMIMSANNIQGYSTTILVNGAAMDVSYAQRYDQVSVKVSVPVPQVFWVGTLFITNKMIESETVAMMRQG